MYETIGVTWIGHNGFKLFGSYCNWCKRSQSVIKQVEVAFAVEKWKNYG